MLSGDADHKLDGAHPIATPNKLKGSKLLMEALEQSSFSYANLLIEKTAIDQQYVDSFAQIVREQAKGEDLDIF